MIMKTQMNKSKVGSLSYFYTFKKTSKIISSILSVAILHLSISCSYFTVKDLPTTEENISKTIDEFNQSEKYAIVHSDSLSWHLNDIVVNDDKQTLSGDILPVDEQHIYKKSRDSKRVHRYQRNKTKPLNEIHFYLKTPSSFQDNQAVTIPLSDIASISVNDKNTGRSIANVFVGTIGTTFAALLIVAALKSSCPFVYLKQIDVKNDEYTIKISNYLKEIQYTDYVQLVLFNHDDNVEVLLDSKGEFQTFKNIMAPKNVVLDDGLKHIEPALKKDNKFYAFNTSVKTENSSRNITFEFDKPKDSDEAKLYLTAKN